MVTFVGNRHGDPSRLDKAVCSSHSVNTLGKSMHSNIFHSIMGK